MAANLLKVVSRTASATRAGFATAVHGQSAVSGHKDGWKLWKKLTFLVAFPGVGLCMLNAYLGATAPGAHDAPEFIAYEHLRIRNKRFPWGDGQKSLFHNSHVNALPNGYEHTDGHH